VAPHCFLNSETMKLYFAPLLALGVCVADDSGKESFDLDDSYLSGSFEVADIEKNSDRKLLTYATEI
jgi:hypothetical protein